MSRGSEGADAPRFLRRMLAWSLPADVREGIEGDLEEAYRDRRTRHGVVRAGAWYGGQALALLVRFLPERLGDASTGSLGVSWLDLKLGFRMLGKHPGLSLAGGSALAVAIAFGAGVYEFFGEFVSIELPFPDGDRVVRVTNWDAEATSGEPRSAADFVAWREQARSIEPLAAVTTLEANVAGPEAVPVPLAGVRATATLFDVIRVPPAVGRPLIPSDELAGAAPVAVVSHRVWTGRLASAPLSDLTLRIAGVEHEVVGVMPEGFRFPVDHHFWVPLHLAAEELEPREGVPLTVFGRLAPGVDEAAAQAELSLLGRRAAERWPATHARLEPRVTGFFEQPGGDWQRWVALGAQTTFGLLLALAALNVAILSFSRTATRQGEIAVRAALGAGRRRIVTQLFAEALVLSGAATAVGLLAAWRMVPRASELFWSDQGVEVPYWVDPGLSAGTIAWALLLGVLGAFIAGAVPALKATGGGIGKGLQGIASGGSALRFGKLPTMVIVVQVALAVAFLPWPASQALARARYETATDALARDRILSAHLQAEVEDVALSLGREPAGGAGASDRNEDRARRFAERLEALRTTLLADPGVLAVGFGERVPGQPHRRAEVRVEGASDDAPGGIEVRTAFVTPGYFEALDARVVAGRTFGPSDIDPGAEALVALANEAFAERTAGAANALGGSIRFMGSDGTEGPWLQIVGIVENLDVNPGGGGLEGSGPPGPVPAIYLPSTLADLSRVQIAVRHTAPAAALGPELRRTAAAVDPGMRLDAVLTLDALAAEAHASEDMLLALAVLLALLVAGLAVGGTYTLMSFLVQQRTREIGIRTALGADPSALMRDVFARALTQLGLGVLVGFVVLAVFLRDADRSIVALCFASAGLVLLAGTAACVLPSRRALRIEPTEALRSE